MSDRPWWYSGDEPQAPMASGNAPSDAPRDASDDSPRVGADWGSLLSGAQRIVDWATETVMAPHAEHGDPRDHPDCMICRAISLVGDVGREPAGTGTTTPDAAGATGRIEWIPIRGEGSAP